MMMLAMTYAFAQQTTVERSRLFDNTTISVFGGASSWMNPSVVNEETFINSFRPSTGIALGKWFTPVMGAELFYDGTINSFPFDANTNRWTFYDWGNLGLNAQFNLNNMFGYKGYARRLELVPFTGVGWGRGYTNNHESNLSDEEGNSNFLTADAGLRLDFNIGQKRAWQINVRPSATWLVSGEGIDTQFSKDRAYASVQVGATYKFGHRNSKGDKVHGFTKAYTSKEYEDLQKEYLELKEKYNQKPKEVTVEKIIERVIERQIPVEVVKNIRVLPMPHFHKGKSVIDATSISNLDELVEEMKGNDDRYLITGYASEEGGYEYNKDLSLRRATTVKNYLVKHGVDKSRLDTRGFGKTSMFGKTYDSNRVVTIEKL